MYTVQYLCTAGGTAASPPLAGGEAGGEADDAADGEAGGADGMHARSAVCGRRAGHGDGHPSAAATVPALWDRGDRRKLDSQ